jgi:hypothetical protein
MSGSGSAAMDKGGSTGDKGGSSKPKAGPDDNRRSGKQRKQKSPVPGQVTSRNDTWGRPARQVNNAGEDDDDQEELVTVSRKQLTELVNTQVSELVNTQVTQLMAKQDKNHHHNYNSNRNQYRQKTWAYDRSRSPWRREDDEYRWHNEKSQVRENALANAIQNHGHVHALIHVTATVPTYKVH